MVGLLQIVIHMLLIASLAKHKESEMNLKELEYELDGLIEIKEKSIDWIDDEELDDAIDEAVTQLLRKMMQQEV